MTEMTQPSIHYRRRWFYALWSGLLLAGLGAYGLWLTPAQVERPDFGLVVETRKLPAGVSIEVWTGPEASWSPKAATGQAGFQALQQRPEGLLVSSPMDLPFAVRRWVPRTLVPSRSHDLVVLRYTEPSLGRRFDFISLRKDWHEGLLRDRKRVVFTLYPKWDKLWTDGGLPKNLR